jgi:hypothetical protein
MSRVHALSVSPRKIRPKRGILWGQLSDACGVGVFRETRFLAWRNIYYSVPGLLVGASGGSDDGDGSGQDPAV